MVKVLGHVIIVIFPKKKVLPWAPQHGSGDDLSLGLVGCKVLARDG
jgi:hypothetical protein